MTRGPNSRILAANFRFHHLGVAVQDIEKSIPIYEDLFGYDMVSGPFVDPTQKVSVCFLSRGQADMTIELVMPMGPDSPVSRTLAQGGSAYHVCYEVPDIAEAINHMAALKCLILSKPVPAVAFQGRSIAWLTTPTRQLIELLQDH